MATLDDDGGPLAMDVYLERSDPAAPELDWCDIARRRLVSFLEASDPKDSRYIGCTRGGDADEWWAVCDDEAFAARGYPTPPRIGDLVDCGRFRDRYDGSGYDHWKVSAAPSLSCATAQRYSRFSVNNSYEAPSAGWECVVGEPEDGFFTACGRRDVSGVLVWSVVTQAGGYERVRARWTGGLAGFLGARGRGPSPSQGGYHELVLRVRPKYAARYRVCLSGPSRRCWRGKTSAAGVGKIHVSLWLNDRGVGAG